MTGYITKYALTQGIIETEFEISTIGGGSMVVVGNSGAKRCFFFGEGKEWHRTRESAVARANEMKAKRIANLKKSLRKLEAMTFA